MPVTGVPVVGAAFYLSVGINYRKRKIYRKKLDVDERSYPELEQRIAGYTLQVVRDRTGALVIPGCGFDAAWDVVMSLARALYPTGYRCIGTRCPASDHLNHPRDTFERHAHGDYALRAEWL